MGVIGKAKRFVVTFRAAYDRGIKPKEKEYANREKAIEWANHYDGICEYAIVFDREERTEIHRAGDYKLWAMCCSEDARRERIKSLKKDLQCDELGATRR